jgi:hypothetical protein
MHRLKRAVRKMNNRGRKNHATWSVANWLAGDEAQYAAARALAATKPTTRQVADFVFQRMPGGTPGMDGPEDYLTVDWEAVREAICQE